MSTINWQTLSNSERRKPTIYTVAIKDLEDNEMDIWISSFSTREKAEAFKQAAERKLKEYGITTVQVCLDSGYLDDDMYLSWLDDRYEDDSHSV